MTHNDLILLLLGSFLPNNLLIWMGKKLIRPVNTDKPYTPHGGTLARTWYAIRGEYHKFEIDPRIQLRYHRRMAIFWLCNFPFVNLVGVLDILAVFGYFPIKVALILNAVQLLVNTNYSLYANWDTETGDAHAAYAGVKALEIQESQAQPIIQSLESYTVMPVPEGVSGDV